MAASMDLEAMVTQDRPPSYLNKVPVEPGLPRACVRFAPSLSLFATVLLPSKCDKTFHTLDSAALEGCKVNRAACRCLVQQPVHALLPGVLVLLFYAPFLESPSVNTMRERPRALRAVISPPHPPTSPLAQNLPTACLEKLWD